MGSTRRAASCTCRPAPRQPIFTAPTSWRQSLRKLPRRARRGDGEAPVAFPDRASRHLGPRPSVPPEPRDRETQRADHRCRRTGDEIRLHLPLRSRDRTSAVPDRIPQVFPERRARRALRRHPAHSRHTEAVRPAAAHAGDVDDADPAAHEWARAEFQNSGAAAVLRFAVGTPTVVFPGFDAARMGGSAVDLKRWMF